MTPEIQSYNNLLSPEDQAIANILIQEMTKNLSDSSSKVRHGHPVWFLNGNPIVGYSKQKRGMCVLFWSGQSFDEENLKPEGSFKASEIIYTHHDQIDKTDLARWLQKAKTIQWDYKNIVKRKGVLEMISTS